MTPTEITPSRLVASTSCGESQTAAAVANQSACACLLFLESLNHRLAELPFVALLIATHFDGTFVFRPFPARVTN